MNMAGDGFDTVVSDLGGALIDWYPRHLSGVLDEAPTMGSTRYG